MKQVRFDPSTSVRRYHHDPGDDRSSSNCSWMTDEDYNRIRRGIKKDVRKARAYARSQGAGDNPPPSRNEDEMTLRGIEHLQSAEVLQRQIHAKDSATEAVYREQERQARARTALDGAALARVYMAHSRQARQVALARAASRHGIIRDIPAEVAAITVLGIAENVIFEYLTNDDIMRSDQLAGAVFEVILSGVLSERLQLNG